MPEATLGHSSHFFRSQASWRSASASLVKARIGPHLQHAQHPGNVETMQSSSRVQVVLAGVLGGGAVATASLATGGGAAGGVGFGSTTNAYGGGGCGGAPGHARRSDVIDAIIAGAANG
jgi:hypothetical protein